MANGNAYEVDSPEALKRMGAIAMHAVAIGSFLNWCREKKHVALVDLHPDAPLEQEEIQSLISEWIWEEFKERVLDPMAQRLSGNERKPYVAPTVTDLGSIEGLLGLEAGELERFRAFYLAHRAELFPPTATENQETAMEAAKLLAGYATEDRQWRHLMRTVDRLRTLEIPKILAAQRDVEATTAICDTLHILNALAPIE